MKLYVSNCVNCNHKVQLNIVAKSRNELRRMIGSNHFNIKCGNCYYQNVFSVNDVWAEPDSSSIVAGGVIGGIVGLIGGPIGAVLGGAIGAAIGGSSDEDEKNKVDFFNRSL